MYLCNKAIEDYPDVIQWKVHRNAIQNSLDNLAEKESRQILRQATSARNIGFRDIHDIMKQGPPRRTTLKEIHPEDVVNGETVIKVQTGQLNVAAAIQAFYKNLDSKRNYNDDSSRKCLRGIDHAKLSDSQAESAEEEFTTKEIIGNLMPITLLSALYKIVYGCITNRLKPRLDTIIKPWQKPTSL